MTSKYLGITIIDVRDPLMPLPISLISITGAEKSVNMLEKDGKYYLYVATGIERLKIIEVSDPKNPLLVRTI